MRHTLVLLAACAVFLAGCGADKSSGPSANGPKVDSPTPGETAATDPDTKPGEPTKDPGAKPAEGAKPEKETFGAAFEKPKGDAPGWTDAGMSAAELGKQISARLAGLKDTSAVCETLATTPEGKGRFKGNVYIRDSKRYRIDYVAVRERPFSGTLLSNGEKRAVRLDIGWSKPFPTTTKLPKDAQTATALMSAVKDADDVPPQLATGATARALWPTQFSRLLFQGLTEGQDGVTPAFEALAKQGAEVQVRDMVYEGRKVKNYRLILDPKDGGGVGQEVVVDAAQFLPVTIRSSWKDPSGKEYVVLWTCSWKQGERPSDENFKGPLGG